MVTYGDKLKQIVWDLGQAGFIGQCISVLSLSFFPVFSWEKGQVFHSDFDLNLCSRHEFNSVHSTETLSSLKTHGWSSYV